MMQTHYKTLSILHIVYGTLNLLTLVFITTIVQSLLPVIFSEADDTTTNIINIILPIARVVAWSLILFIPLPSIFGGIALLNGRKWGLTMLLISGSLSILSFPFGTGLGVYTIWVFTQQQKDSND